MPNSGLEQRMASRVAELRREARLRELSTVSGLNLCSNDYLGLAEDARLKHALLQAVEKSERVGSTGSRLLSGHHLAWESLEAEFAAFAGTEAALYFSSGYAANAGLLGALLTPDDVVFSDALNHASIIDGLRLGRARKVVYPHCDLNFLEDSLRRSDPVAGAKIIVTETIFSMDGDRAPLPDIFHLAERYGAEIVLDEAHATAACGPRGRGLAAELGLETRALALVHTCGKALAGMGALVCGSTTLKRFLVNHARSFIFSTALPPYCAHQIGAAVRLAQPMEAERERLASLSASLRGQMQARGWNCGASGSHIIPLIVGGNQETLDLAGALREQGFAVRAIRFPSVPAGTERLRLSLTAKITRDDLERFIAAVEAARALQPQRVS